MKLICVPSDKKDDFTLLIRSIIIQQQQKFQPNQQLPLPINNLIQDILQSRPIPVNMNKDSPLYKILVHTVIINACNPVFGFKK